MKIVKSYPSVDWWSISLEPLAKNGTSTDCSDFICYNAYENKISTKADWCFVKLEKLKSTT